MIVTNLSGSHWCERSYLVNDGKWFSVAQNAGARGMITWGEGARTLSVIVLTVMLTERSLGRKMNYQVDGGLSAIAAKDVEAHVEHMSIEIQ